MHNGQTINDLWEMTEKFFRADVARKREQVSSGGVEGHASAAVGQVALAPTTPCIHDALLSGDSLVRPPDGAGIETCPLEEASEIVKREQQALEHRQGLEGDYGDAD